MEAVKSISIVMVGLLANIYYIMQESNLFKVILETVSKIPKGKVATYGQIAGVVGTKDARKVGWALHTNEDPIKYPCHRVVKKNGSLAPGYVFGGPDEQKLILLSEGVVFKPDNTIDLTNYLCDSSDLQ